MKVLYLQILLGFLSFSVFGQGNVTLRIVNKETGESLPFANVCFENTVSKERAFASADATGKLSYNIKGKSLIAVTFVGFETKMDTVSPGETKTISLVPGSYEVDETVITAQYQPVKKDQSIYKVQVIGLNQINQKAANNLDELLASELNVKISKDGVLGSKVNLQGLSGEHVKILIDGIPVIGRMEGNIDLSQINLSNVDHVEIIEGPMSVVYGSNALAGAINIITKEDKLHRFTSTVGTVWESAGIYDLKAAISGKIKKNSVSLALSRNFFDGFTTKPLDRNLEWDPKRQYEANGYWVRNLKTTRYKYTLNYFNELIQNRGSLMAPYFETAFDQFFYTNRINNNLDFTKNFKKEYKLNILGSYSYYNRIKNTWFKDLTTLNKNLTSNPQDHDTSVFDAIIFRGFLAHASKNKHFEYQAGYDINYESGSGKRILDENQSISDYAIFTTFRIQPDSHLNIQPGLRLSYNSKYPAIPVYSLNIKYDLNKKTQLRTSVARGFRAPSLKELYLYFVDVNHNVQGNPELEAENSWNANISAGYTKEKGKNSYMLDASLFFNSVNNIITLARKQGLVYEYVNVDRYLTQGMQLNFTYKMHPRFSFSTGTALNGTTATVNSTSAEFGKFFYYNDVSAGMNYKNVKYGFGWTFSYKYNGKKPQLNVDDAGNVTQGYLFHYHLMDFTMRKTWFEEKLYVSAGVKNIFNYTNIISSGSSSGSHSSSEGFSPVGWGRTFFVDLSYRFSRI